MSTPQNKEIAKKTQEILKELGHDVSLGHAYELLSRIAGFKSWNVAAKSPEFITKIQEVFTEEPEQIQATKNGNRRQFKIFLKKMVQAEKAYIFQAEDEKEARKIMNQYIDYQNGELHEYDSKGNRAALKKGVSIHPEVLKLVALEDDSDFIYKNWFIEEHALFGEGPEISSVYNY